jgi:chorismate dehydratase
MTHTSAIATVDASRRVLRVGAVSYLNARPLIHGLDSAGDLQLILDVPSRLLDGLQRHAFDVALLPVIDYQRQPGLQVLTAGGIGCDGPTLTVRIFSRVPIGRIAAMACDSDSHTSVALARIILAEKFGIQPDFADWSAGQEHPAEARLLIGDKVVCEEPPGYEHQLDLGQAWHELTGLPFVFAVWMARAGVDLADLPERLERAKLAGMADFERIIRAHAQPRGWPAGIALQYLTYYLKFDVGPRQLAAIRLFHELAAKHGLVPSPARGLVLHGQGAAGG